MKRNGKIGKTESRKELKRLKTKLRKLMKTQKRFGIVTMRKNKHIGNKNTNLILLSGSTKSKTEKLMKKKGKKENS